MFFFGNSSGRFSDLITLMLKTGIPQNYFMALFMFARAGFYGNTNVL